VNQNRLLLLKGPESPFLLVLREDKLHVFNLIMLVSEDDKLIHSEVNLPIKRTFNMVETEEFVIVVGLKQISWTFKNDLFVNREGFQTSFSVEDYTEIRSVKVNPLNSGYVGVLNDKNKFYLVNLNGTEREELIEFERYVYEDMDTSIAELE